MRTVSRPQVPMSSGRSQHPSDNPLRGRIFACLRPREITIHVLPGVGLADGGRLFDAPLHVVPFDTRTPNTDVWVQFDRSMRITDVWRRDDGL